MATKDELDRQLEALRRRQAVSQRRRLRHLLGQDTVFRQFLEGAGGADGAPPSPSRDSHATKATVHGSPQRRLSRDPGRDDELEALGRR